MTFGSTGDKNKRALCSFLKPQSFRTSKSFHTSRVVDCKKGFWAILFYCQTLDTKVMISMMMVLSHDQFPLEIDFGKKITPDRNPSSLSNIWLFQSHVNILERFLHSLRLPVHLCLITRPFHSAKKKFSFRWPPLSQNQSCTISAEEDRGDKNYVITWSSDMQLQLFVTL